MQYKAVSQPGAALVGVENSVGSRAAVYSKDNSPPLTAGTAVTFVPFSGRETACTFLAVTLADFYAEQVADFVRLTWETNSELDNRGFNLYRGVSAAGPDRQLNEALIPSQSQGSPGGFVYTWEDQADLAPGATYFYWVEAVDIYGAATIHGPVSVDFAVPTAVTLGRIQASPAAGQPSLLAGTLLALFAPLIGVLAARRRRSD